jgi:hypothetical protein
MVALDRNGIQPTAPAAVVVVHMLALAIKEATPARAVCMVQAVAVVVPLVQTLFKAQMARKALLLSHTHLHLPQAL